MRNDAIRYLLAATVILLAVNLAGVNKTEVRASTNTASIVGIAACADAGADGREKRYLYRLWSDGRIDELEHPGYANPTGTLQYKWYIAHWTEIKLKDAK